MACEQQAAAYAAAYTAWQNQIVYVDQQEGIQQQLAMMAAGLLAAWIQCQQGQGFAGPAVSSVDSPPFRLLTALADMAEKAQEHNQAIENLKRLMDELNPAKTAGEPPPKN